MNFNKRTVAITGGSQGIGRAIAEGFAKNGDFVYLIDIDTAKLKQTSAELGENVIGITTDITKEKDIQQAFNQIRNQHAGIDILVNNAGIQHIAPVEDFTLEDWHRVMDTILTGTFLMTKYALPHMQQQKWGRILTISSGHGRRPDKYKSAYCAAKAGQINFTNVVAMENALKGITANSILPGATNTELIQNQLGALAQQDGTSEQEALETHILGHQWMKQLIEPSEIADLAVFLASDGAAKITGESIAIDGGE